MAEQALPGRTTHRRAAFVLAACTAIGACLALGGALAADRATTQAATDAGPLPWATLTAAQQQVLEPVRVQWPRLLPRQQQRLLRMATHAQEAPDDQRAVIAQRIAQWAAMTPEQRAGLGARFEKFRALPVEQQQELRDAFERYRALPPEERRQLRDRYDRMTPGERDAFAAGAAMATRNRGWQRLMAGVPEAERAATRQAWLGLDATARHALRRYLGTLAVEQRGAVLRELVATPPAERAAFIAKRDPAPPIR